MLRSISVPRAASWFRPGPLAAGLLLLLAWSSAAPASAESGTISGSRTSTVYVDPGDTLYITAGAQISADPGVVVFGGTLIISGGTISGTTQGMSISGGTVTISGGMISGQEGVVVHSGTVSISGGTISGTTLGVDAYVTTVSVYGCGLQLSNINSDAVGLLTGTLQDGMTIDTYARLSPSGLINTCAYSWSGVLPPVNADGSSVFKAGSTVPVKFALTGADAGNTTLAATLWVAKISNSIVGTDLEAVATNTPVSTGNSFRYDPTSGQCIFNWSTKGLAAGTYLLSIDLGDGAPHTVTVSLR
jgi:hypothetical protein